MKIGAKIILVLIVASLSLFSFCSCDEMGKDGITLEEFNKIKNGMTYEEVVEIIGCEGEVLSSGDLGIGSEYATEIYMWEGESGLGANANVTFQGGKVVSKAQFGLK